MKYSFLALFLPGICVLSSALANDNLSDPYYQEKHKNIIYIQGDMGFATLSTPSEVLVAPDSTNQISNASYLTSSIAGGGAFGFKRAVTDRILIGGELGYDYNGRSRYIEYFNPGYSVTESTTYKITSQDLHMLATGTYLFKSGFNLFAKGGVAQVEQRFKITGQVFFPPLPIDIGETSITSWKPMAAVGLGYQFRFVDIYGEYSHIFGKDPKNFEELFNQDGTFTDIVSVDTFKLGLGVHTRI